MNRNEKQLEIIEETYNDLKSGQNMTLDIVMQFGKTVIAVAVIDMLLNDGYTVQIVTPSLSTGITWKQHIDKHILSGRAKAREKLHDIMVKTSHSILEGDISETDYVIFDEIHLFLTKERYKILCGQYIKFKTILGLTGTVPTDIQLQGRLYAHAPVAIMISESYALKQGWIAKFIEYNVELEYSEPNKARYVQYTNTIKNILQNIKGVYRYFKYPDGKFIFFNDIDLIYSLYRGKKTYNGYLTGEQVRTGIANKMGWDETKAYTDYMKERTFWKPSNLKQTGYAFYVAIKERNTIMYNNYIKLGAVLRVVAKYGNIPTVCFNESQEFAEILADSVNNTFTDGRAVCYHSKIKSRPMINPDTGKPYVYGDKAKKAGLPVMFGRAKILDDVVEGLGTGKYNFLSVVKAIDNSVTLKNTQVAILTSGSINSITHRQRTSRIKALNIYDKDKTVYIINLYFGDFDWLEAGEGDMITTMHSSRDRVKLSERQRDSINVKWIKFDEFVKNSL